MLEIDFIGYNGTHQGDFFYGLPPGHSSYLLLLTSTPAEFFLDNEFRRFPAGSAILYTPGSTVLYRACEDRYINDWIRFRSDESFVQKLPLQNTPFEVNDAPYCHQLFKLLTWETTLGSAKDNELLYHLIHALFLKLGESCSRPMGMPHTRELIELRKEIYNSPERPWSVEEMAENLHLSTGYFQALYKSIFHCSCMEDVILQRLRRAQDQLLGTSKSIREIAESCGYNNVEHFCRQFRKFLGSTPGQYRRTASRDIRQRPSGEPPEIDRYPSPEKKAQKTARNSEISHRTLGGLEVDLYGPPTLPR